MSSNETPEQILLRIAYQDGILSQKEYRRKLKALDKPTKKDTEPFDIKKFNKIFAIFNPVEWIKTLKEIGILDVRKWIIYLLIFGGLYGYGYVKGVSNKPVHFNLEGKEATIKLNEHYLKIMRDGTAHVQDEDGNILKTIAVKDIPELKRALKPIGIDIHPFFTAGGGIGSTVKNGENKSTSGLEAGVGLSLFKWYKFHMNTWLTNRGIYLGPDYKMTNNFSIIGGLGKGFEGGTRAYIGGKWEF